MITGPIAFAVVGVILIVLGLQTWKNQKASFLHDNHYKNVKEEDLPAYTRAAGIGQIVTGAGLILTGLVRRFTESWISWVPLVAALVVGFAILHSAQKKYNGGWGG